MFEARCLDLNPRGFARKNNNSNLIEMCLRIYFFDPVWNAKAEHDQQQRALTCSCEMYETR